MNWTTKKRSTLDDFQYTNCMLQTWVIDARTQIDRHIDHRYELGINLKIFETSKQWKCPQLERPLVSFTVWNKFWRQFFFFVGVFVKVADSEIHTKNQIRQRTESKWSFCALQALPPLQIARVFQCDEMKWSDQIMKINEEQNWQISRMISRRTVLVCLSVTHSSVKKVWMAKGRQDRKYENDDYESGRISMNAAFWCECVSTKQKSVRESSFTHTHTHTHQTRSVARGVLVLSWEWVWEKVLHSTKEKTGKKSAHKQMGFVAYHLRCIFAISTNAMISVQCLTLCVLVSVWVRQCLRPETRAELYWILNFHSN